MENNNTQIEMQSRWLTRRDMKDVMPILLDTLQEEAPTEDEFLELLRGRNRIAMVATDEQAKIAGVLVYVLHSHRIDIEILAVAPNKQGQGFGRYLVNRLLPKLGRNRRSIAIDVSEFNVEAQCFLKACGFVCVKQTRNGWNVGNYICDAYSFSRGKTCLKLSNRISQHLQTNQ